MSNENQHTSPTYLVEVPAISYLKNQGILFLCTINTTTFQATDSWNTISHHILETCQLQSKLPNEEIPTSCYWNQSCGHMLHIELDSVATKALHLTMLEKVPSNYTSPPYNVSCIFIHAIMFRNLVWDLGMQHKLALILEGYIISRCIHWSNVVPSIFVHVPRYLINGTNLNIFLSWITLKHVKKCFI